MMKRSLDILTISLLSWLKAPWSLKVLCSGPEPGLRRKIAPSARDTEQYRVESIRSFWGLDSSTEFITALLFLTLTAEV